MSQIEHNFEIISLFFVDSRQMCISVVIQNGAIFCVIIDSKKFSTELTCRITVLFVEHRSNSSMVEPREILLTKARFILPVNAIPVLTSHGSRFQHSSTGANHSLRICDVKICIAFAGSMNQASTCF